MSEFQERKINASINLGNLINAGILLAISWLVNGIDTLNKNVATLAEKTAVNSAEIAHLKDAINRKVN